VIVDWVPAHFPRDSFGLAFFDGTHLYEHADPRMGEHKDWGTLIFNYGAMKCVRFCFLMRSIGLMYFILMVCAWIRGKYDLPGLFT